MAKKVRISLANKCQLLFGAAVVLILSAALTVVWSRMHVLVREGQEMTARKLAEAWLTGKIELGVSLKSVEEATKSSEFDEDSITLIAQDELDIASRDPFLAQAITQFQNDPHHNELSGQAEDTRGHPYFRYARAIRKSDLTSISGGAAAGFRPALEVPGLANPLQMVLFIQLHSDSIARQLMLNRVFLIFAGLVAGLLAIAAFWFITTRLILSPVRVLRQTAEKVSDGDLNIRAEINTGDEFEQLADIFNHMLENLKANQEQLRGINKSMDLKLGELAESNVALYEANKIKGEFLANVSHELRTPLNSIIGFAEVLEETLKDRTGPVDEKRKRYAANIISSSRRLLDLINDLLDLAKIEAGRVELHVAAMSIADTIEGLVNLIRPQAEKRGVELVLRLDPHIRPVITDASKLQQILFNFLSNAIKFTPPGGRITMTARMIGGTDQSAIAAPCGSAGISGGMIGGASGTVGDTMGASGGASGGGIGGASGDGAGPITTDLGAERGALSASVATSAGNAAVVATAGSMDVVSETTHPGNGALDEANQRLCISVSDTGPGIPLDQQERVFDKFTQLDSTVTKEFQGTGLGLTICRELAGMLQGQIILDSDVGRGATFSLVLPMVLEARSMALMPDLAGGSSMEMTQAVVRLAATPT